MHVFWRLVPLISLRGTRRGKNVCIKCPSVCRLTSWPKTRLQVSPITSDNDDLNQYMRFLSDCTLEHIETGTFDARCLTGFTLKGDPGQRRKLVWRRRVCANISIPFSHFVRLKLNLKKSWLPAFWKRIKTRNRLNRKLSNRAVPDKMHIFKKVPFFKPLTLQKRTMKEVKGLIFLPVELDPTG